MPEHAPLEAGFELDGQFYSWSVTTHVRDLRMIEHFTKMGVQEFFEVVDDSMRRGHISIICAMMAASVRATHPDWSVERIIQLVDNADLANVEFIVGDEDAGVAMPAGDGQSPPDSSTEPVTNELSSDVPSLQLIDQPDPPETSSPVFESFSATQA